MIRYLGVVMLALLLLSACAEGATNSVGFDDLFPPLTPAPDGVATLVATPTTPPAATPTATPTATPSPLPVATPDPTTVTVSVVQSADMVSADGNWYIVEGGDHLWAIARAALRNATGAIPNNRSISDYVGQIVAANDLSNPNLIYPNERVRLPLVGR